MTRAVGKYIKFDFEKYYENEEIIDALYCYGLLYVKLIKKPMMDSYGNNVRISNGYYDYYKVKSISAIDISIELKKGVIVSLSNPNENFEYYLLSNNTLRNIYDFDNNKFNFGESYKDDYEGYTSAKYKNISECYMTEQNINKKTTLLGRF